MDVNSIDAQVQKMMERLESHNNKPHSIIKPVDQGQTEQIAFDHVLNSIVKEDKSTELVNQPKESAVTGQSDFIDPAELYEQETRTRPVVSQPALKIPEGPLKATQRQEVWNHIAAAYPELLTSNVDQGRYETLREAQTIDIRNKLTAFGLDSTSAQIIASREAGTTVRREDGVVPGPGISGYHTLPNSVQSVVIDKESGLREGTGYGYQDRYGVFHVTYDLARALNYSGDGNTYRYNGQFANGYAAGMMPVIEDNHRENPELEEAKERLSLRKMSETDIRQYQ